MQKDHRSQECLKQHISQRDKLACSQPQRKRELAFLSDPVKKQHKAKVQKDHRSQECVKQHISQRDKLARSQPATKKMRTEREQVFLSDPVKKQHKAEVQKDHRSQECVKQHISHRDKLVPSQPATKKKRTEREQVFLTDPLKKQHKAQVQKDHRSQECVRQHISQQNRLTHNLSKDQKKQCEKKKHVIQTDSDQLLNLDFEENNFGAMITNFHQLVSEKPTFVCHLCKKFRFKFQMMNTADVHNLLCKSCHKYSRSKKVPPSAEENKLKVMAMPPHLQDLNSLERYLITPLLPFMKIIPLVKGGQPALRGPVICVASNIQSTAELLPHPLHDHSFIKVKLKRKLSYKGHQLYQNVRPRKIFDALDYLKEHHPAFSGKYISYVYFF